MMAADLGQITRLQGDVSRDTIASFPDPGSGGMATAAVEERPSTPLQRLGDQDVEDVRSAILAKLTLDVGRNPTNASDRDWYVATALSVRDRVVHGWMESNRRTRIENRKKIYYLSLEFLIGRLLRDVLHNLGVTEVYAAALGDLGVDLERLRVAEPDAALGNGGLGRLAACFMESMASLSLPAWGYGIR
jgi:starch phosphorylase